MDQWFIRKTNPDFIEYLSRAVSITPILAQVLVNRGINSPEKARGFLNPLISLLSDPWTFPGLEKAVSRIRKAAQAGEKVLVHGDYDADGLTATAIMMLTLRRMGVEADFFIPSRFEHGYGFNAESIDVARNSGASLILTVDCGINAFEETTHARKNGLDVIITDHHEPFFDDNGNFLLPEALALVNPKIIPNGIGSPLCGAGVALMMSIALLGLEFALEFFDLAAIGTVADMVPLLGDNRAIVTEGLKLINGNSRISLRALKEAAGVSDKALTAGMLSFTLIPRINASGRVSEASDVVRLFMSEDLANAQEIAQRLNNNNTLRYRIEDGVYREALAMVDDQKHQNCIVLANEGWHEGVVGIVASKIADRYKRPAFIFSVKDGVARGSARSVAAFDICAGLKSCSDLLIQYGGHKQAAGLTLKSDNLDSFVLAIDTLVADALRNEDISGAMLIDAEIPLRDVTFPFLQSLSGLEPFGFGNEEPLFASRNLEVLNPRIVGKNHLKMKLRDASSTIDAIGFDMGDSLRDAAFPGNIDAVFAPSINEWNGGRFLQLNLKAIRPVC